MDIAKSLSTTLFTATVVVLAALAVKPAAHSSTIAAADAGLETVTVSAHRMSEAEKAAFDRMEADQHTVTITAHRLTNEEKAAFDRSL